jgi:hypothetical protein
MKLTMQIVEAIKNFGLKEAIWLYFHYRLHTTLTHKEIMLLLSESGAA